MAKDHTIPTPAAAETPKDDNSIIHTMPKKFVTAHPSTHDHKSMGILILAVGLVVLFAGLGGLYYFLDKSNFFGKKTAVETIPEDTAKVDEPAKTEPAKTEAKTEPVNTVKDVVATTSPAVATTTEPATADLTATTTEEVTATTTEPAQITNDADADIDGLTDLEEALLNTNPALPDSDGDGFTDLAELKNLYNPAGTGKLIVNPSIEKYTNPEYQYSLYYPKTWDVTSLTENDSVIFQLPNGQFMQAIIQPNIEKLSIEDWYKKQFGEYSIKPGQVILKKGWTGIQSEDGMVYYLINPNDENIYTLNYNLGITNTVSYKNVFDMMVMSLELK